MSLIPWLPRTRGPWEPVGFAILRHDYWRRSIWVEQLETRIQMTDAGLAWLCRVKRIGRA